MLRHGKFGDGSELFQALGSYSKIIHGKGFKSSIQRFRILHDSVISIFGSFEAGIPGNTMFTYSVFSSIGQIGTITIKIIVDHVSPSLQPYILDSIHKNIVTDRIVT